MRSGRSSRRNWARQWRSFSPHSTTTPIASASIGQVHRATLLDGQEVVVKVQRPGIEDEVEADLDLLLRQARFLERRSETMRDYNVVAIAEELARSVREELDYQIEGRNAERLRTNLRSDPPLCGSPGAIGA